MKYYIHAKILGTFLPNKTLRINGCKIRKTYNSDHRPYDRPTLPTTEIGFMYHSLAGGVKNFIFYPQKPISVRTFESEYEISTEVQAPNIDQAVSESVSRFEGVIAVLSLSLKTTVRKIGNRRIKRDDEYYDFEIVAAYIKRQRQYIRVKLPEPLVNGHNFFPSQPPKGFVSKSKKFLKCTDQVFWKGLLYVHNASTVRDSGNFDETLVTLNFVKCIELISGTVIKQKKNKGKRINMKDRITLAGKKIKVTNNNIKYAKQAWDVRNDSDIAHARPHRGGAFPNFFRIQSAASEFLIKYFKYISSNPPQVYVFGGKAGWRMTY